MYRGSYLIWSPVVDIPLQRILRAREVFLSPTPFRSLHHLFTTAPLQLDCIVCSFLWFLFLRLTCSETEIGELIASAMERVGNEGVITVQVRPSIVCTARLSSRREWLIVPLHQPSLVEYFFQAVGVEIHEPFPR